MEDVFMPIDVEFTEQSELTMESIEEVNLYLFDGFFRIKPSGKRLPAEFLYGAVMKGFTFSKNKLGVVELFWERTKVMKINFMQKFVHINPVYPDLLLHTRQLVYERLLMLPKGFLYILGDHSMDLSTIKIELQETV